MMVTPLSYVEPQTGGFAKRHFWRSAFFIFEISVSHR
jgi:hypothetical protein